MLTSNGSSENNGHIEICSYIDAIKPVVSCIFDNNWQFVAMEILRSFDQCFSKNVYRSIISVKRKAIVPILIARHKILEMNNVMTMGFDESIDSLRTSNLDTVIMTYVMLDCLKYGPFFGYATGDSSEILSLFLVRRTDGPL